MPKVSVIIPVYNVESYLSLCVDSVRNQTLEDIEIICVDDGSTDRSLQLLREYKAVEPRLVIVCKTNSGPSAARNVALHAATGEFIMSVDADDFLEPNACERVVEAFGSVEADIVTFGAYPYPRYSMDSWQMDVLSPRDAYYPEFHPDVILKEKSYPFAWRSAFRRDFVLNNEIFYDEEIRFGEDTIVLLRAYPQAKGVLFVSDRLIDYRLDRDGSAMRGTLWSKSQLAAEHVAIAERVVGVWKEIGFFDRYPVESFDWLMSFAMRFVLVADKDKDMLMDALGALMRDAFDAGFLAERAEQDFSVRAVLFDRRMRKSPLLLLSYDARHDGMSLAGAAKRNFRHDFIDKGIILKARSAAGMVLPAPESSLEVYERGYDWNVQDRTDRLRTLAMLIGEPFDENCLRSSIQVAREKGSARKTQVYYRRKIEALQEVFASQCNALLEKAVDKAATQN